MRFGFFDDLHLEYVITRPDTPLPWINYLGTESYFGIISNTAGGYSFYKDARLRRLIRFRYNNAPLDGNGRYVYLRDDDAAQPDFWSPTWQPTRTPLDAYTCRHGLGYTRIASQRKGITCETTYFVPLGQDLEVWDVHLTNQRGTAANLSLFSAVEFCLWDAFDDANNFQRNYSIGEVEVVDGVIYHKSEYRERRDHFAYFACSEPLAGYDTQREDFLGPYRGWDAPAAVEEGKARQSLALGWQPMGSHHVRLHLEPGESKRVIFVLGYHENPENDKFDPAGTQTINKKTVLPVIRRFLQPDVVSQALADIQQYWRNLLQGMQVDTPNEHANRMINIWNVYQLMVTFNFSRSSSYFESGVGRGMGFRDSAQDLLGFVQLDAQRARQRILDLAATQMASGGAYHQYQPLTKRGNHDVGSNFNDDPLWLVLAVTAYLKESGDWSILQEQVPFDLEHGSEDSLLAHMERSLNYTQERLGPHGLPLIGRADWNDCLNLNCFSDKPGQSFQTTTNREGKVAESVFIGGLFVLAAAEMEAVYDRLGLTAKAAELAAQRVNMRAVLNTAGWDGSWFRRAYDHFGNPLGSQECTEGQIFVEPQGMCVMAGVGLEDGRAESALNAVREHLGTPHGVVVLWPAFKQYYLHIGEISSYPPGYKENGSVFCHTNPWIQIAEARLGRGERALDYYLRINPSAREEISEVHRCEPYAYAQMIAGKEAVKPGEAKNSWLTGTAAWSYVAVTQWILGIRPTFDGLKIAPVVPEDWTAFDVQRTFRGVRYFIHVERVGAGNAVRLEVEGAPVEGDVVGIPSGGQTEVRVRAYLGTA
ncbi:GH36-type glycosyl hydrolase domain-containing protein [Levilinea saccharolytica]|uniref:Glycosyl transferase n=1 Tax=Levilinea saccharolytica TaxID=229921 RepID=A0A0P6XCX9_9CHLR|nr:glycosyl transferase [Levilinea saccharolytica]KPL80721.1 glycosyl transferase [Levilinea saccharolytica]GAP17206.1 cellobiose phosphorylase [Levilinea saccharolytica]